MAILWLRRVGNVLHADGDGSVEALSKLPINKLLKAEVKQPRRAKHHRLYWEMCHRIGNAVGSDPETVSDMLKVQTGYCTVVKSKSHGVLYFPKSISWAALDQQGFSEFFEKCLTVIQTEWSIARSDMLSILGDLIDPKGMTVR